MSKIFFAFSSGIGPLIRCLPIANELRNRGHEIGFYAIDKASEFMIENNHKKIDLEPIEPPNNELLVEKNPTYPSLSVYYSFLGYQDRDFVRRKIKAWLNLIKSYRPNVIVSDCCLEASIVSKITNLPMVFINQSVFQVNNHIRFWEETYWENEIVIANINDILRRYSVPEVNRVEELFQGDINIYPSIPEFDPSNQQDIVYTGPIIWDGYNYATSNQNEYQRDSEKKMVTVYTGRMNDLGGGNSGLIIFRQLIEVFRSIDCNVRLTTGGLDDIPEEDLSNIPENVTIYKWLPVSKLYEHTDLIIHHGGHGSCLSSIIHGTPTLVLPTHSEREYNARRLSAMGISEFINPRTSTVEELKLRIKLMLGNVEYAKMAQKFSEIIKQREYKKEILAADLVEGLL